MQDVSLTFAVGSTARLKPVIDGEIRPEGVELRTTVKRVADIFLEMPQSEPYDVSEMSITGYLWAIQHGRRWVAIPIFPGWVFGCHADTMVNVHAGIERTADLKGKRVGVPEYAVAAISWIRDAWQRECGLAPRDVRWCEERTEQTSHYRLMGYQPPAPNEIIPEDKCLCDMLVAGELDAVTRYFGGSASDRSRMTMAALADHPNVRWLYADRKAAVLDYYRAVGWPQPIHTVVVKQDVVDRYPWVPRRLYDALAEAARRTQGHATMSPSGTFSPEEERQLIGSDFSAAGLGDGNHKILARILELAIKDGFLVGDRRFSVEELFHPSTVEA